MQGIDLFRRYQPAEYRMLREPDCKRWIEQRSQQAREGLVRPLALEAGIDMAADHYSVVQVNCLESLDNSVSQIADQHFESRCQAIGLCAELLRDQVQLYNVFPVRI